MIILEDDETTSVSSPTTIKSPTDVNPTPLPPAYADAVASGSPSNSPPYPYLLAADVERQRRHPPGENAKRRFLKAFAVALCFWLLFGLFIGSFSLSFRSTPGGVEIEIPRRRKPPLSAPIRSQKCVHGRNLTSRSILESVLGLSFSSLRSSTAQFSIPANADRISFFSNVSQSVGSFHLEAKSMRSEYVDVDVELTSFAGETPKSELAQVCLVSVNGNWEVVIMSGRLSSLKKTAVKYDITARVPPGLINALHTNLPIATHKFANLSDKIHFGELEIQTSNALISSGSVSAGRTTIRTSNAPILGDYTFNDSVELVTRNAVLDVNIHSLAAGSAKSGKERTIVLHTENARVGANIHIPSSLKNNTQVMREVSKEVSEQAIITATPISIDARTSNADVSLVVFSSAFQNIPRAPSRARTTVTPLRISARSVNAPVKVTPGGDFIGTFHLETHGAGGCAHVQQSRAIQVEGTSTVTDDDNSDSSSESEDYSVPIKADARTEVGKLHGIHRVVDIWEDTNTASCHSPDTPTSLELLYKQKEKEDASSYSDRYSQHQVETGGGALVEGRTWLGGVDGGYGPGKGGEEGWVKLETVNADVVLRL